MTILTPERTIAIGYTAGFILLSIWHTVSVKLTSAYKDFGNSRNSRTLQGLALYYDSSQNDDRYHFILRLRYSENTFLWASWCNCEILGHQETQSTEIISEFSGSGRKPWQRTLHGPPGDSFVWSLNMEPFSSFMSSRIWRFLHIKPTTL
ncbi:hypothetical protein V6N11_064557 [Hibiscus sabdariffa]|uniref:Photosystem I assembly protein Ycf4 n=1 Tax=Hibiscus sabdariffa TaxID=183260 RepID=A0ABR2ND17_9ROSI